MKSIDELDVFKLAYQMTLKIYEITKSFPSDERYGLTSQMRRSVNKNTYEDLMRNYERISQMLTGLIKALG